MLARSLIVVGDSSCGRNLRDEYHQQIRAIMESTGEYKDARVIRQLLDEALRARRLKALGYADNEPPGQGTAETLNASGIHSRYHLKNFIEKNTFKKDQFCEI